MVYRFKSASYLSGVSAQAAGEQCERLAIEGRLTAKELVNENRPEDAPLHKAFEWRDDIAAEQWREQQARHIMASLVLVREDAEPVRAFFNIVREEAEYRHIESILQSADETEALLKTALRELCAFQKKYAMLRELAGVFAETEKLLEESRL